MALSGLVLAGFVLGHMSGNLLMFKGPEAINTYAAWLHANKGLLWGARIVLAISTIAHLWTGIQLTLENRASRDGGPAVDATATDPEEQRDQLSLDLCERRPLGGAVADRALAGRGQVHRDHGPSPGRPVVAGSD